VGGATDFLVDRSIKRPYNRVILRQQGLLE
jgi:hypothetical protein